LTERPDVEARHLWATHDEKLTMKYTETDFN